MRTAPFFDRITDVEREHRLAARAVAELSLQRRRLVQVLADLGLSDGHRVKCERHLEGTYIVRIFAEFEMALRLFWQVKKNKPELPRTAAEQLIDCVAARCKINSAEAVEHVHDVREYRNSLVHGGAPTKILALADCRSYLCTFLAWLPHEW